MKSDYPIIPTGYRAPLKKRKKKPATRDSHAERSLRSLDEDTAVVVETASDVEEDREEYGDPVIPGNRPIDIDERLRRAALMIETIKAIPTHALYASLRERYRDATIEYFTFTPDWTLELITEHTKYIEEEVVLLLRKELQGRIQQVDSNLPLLDAKRKPKAKTLTDYQLRVSNFKESLLELKRDQLLAAINFMIEFKYQCGCGKSKTAASNGPSSQQQQQGHTTPTNGPVATQIAVSPWHLSPPQSPGDVRPAKLPRS